MGHDDLTGVKQTERETDLSSARRRVTAVALAEMLGPSWLAAACGKVSSHHRVPQTAKMATMVVIPEPATGHVATAKADAARRTGVAVGDWEVVEVIPRSWPDAGLGCFPADGIYAQVITPGYLIELRAADHSLEYHAGAGRVVYCRG